MMRGAASSNLGRDPGERTTQGREKGSNVVYQRAAFVSLEEDGEGEE